MRRDSQKSQFLALQNSFHPHSKKHNRLFLSPPLPSSPHIHTSRPSNHTVLPESPKLPSVKDKRKNSHSTLEPKPHNFHKRSVFSYNVTDFEPKKLKIPEGSSKV